MAAGCVTFFWLVGGEITGLVLQESCAQPEVTILHLGGGLSSCRRTQRYYYICSLRRSQDPAPRLHYCFFLSFFFFYKFIYLFILAALGLRCCAWAFSGCGERGLLFVVVRGLLVAVASLVVEHGL